MVFSVVRLSGAILLAALVCGAPAMLLAADPLLFVSSFAGGENGAIQAYHFDSSSGQLKPAERTGDMANPFFMALSPNGRYLYAIHALSFGGKTEEDVAAYEILDGNGKLKLLNRQSAKGSAACYLDVDATGKTVLVANYSTGNAASLPVNDDGSLQPAASVHQHADVDAEGKPIGPHAHSIVASPDNRFALAADLGIDQVLSYRLDAATGKLSANDPPFARTAQGAGPRHLTFHPTGNFVYVVNERGNTVTLFDYATETGQLTKRQTISTLPADFDGKSYTADLKITPDGRFLYATNRGHDSIAAYELADNGELTLLEIEPSLGKGPQNLAITPDGKWLLCANMPGNNLLVFAIDASGKISPHGEPVVQTSPACIMLLP
ncbi:lactonase family protein [Lignipirellula cremea]|uniref:6-phosphogluconolactonase n=1 Tax=Lignipirellula cremea TaxID=2528010 RepID=A0A518DT87_9BACT|nr:lactonase family protein [Lignipirellula cremea]QDU95050.1 6-phosphogluconolactonase [Lignipirellula cremea]